MTCPNKNDKMYILMEQALGEGLAHLVVNRNNGYTIDYTRDGESSNLFNELLEKYHGNEVLAIRAKATYYGGVYLKKNNWLSENGNVNEQGEPKVEIDIYDEEDVHYAPQKTVSSTKSIDITPLINKFSTLYEYVARERDTPTSYKVKLLRLDKIRENLKLLRETQNPIDNIITIADSHYEYLVSVIASKDVNTDEVYSAMTMLDIWLDLKNLVPLNAKSTPEIEKIHGKFHTLSIKFDKVLEDTFIREVKNESGIKLTRASLKTKLEDRNFASAYTLASSRSGNIAVQAINSFLDTARVESKQAQMELEEELKEIETLSKSAGINLKDLLHYSDNKAELKNRLTEEWFEALSDIRQGKSNAIKAKSVDEMRSWWLSTRKFILKNATVLNVSDFFDFDENTGYTRKDNPKAMEYLMSLIKYGNKKSVERLIAQKLDEQEVQLKTFYDNYLIKKEQLASNEIEQDEFDRFMNNDSPESYVLELNKSKKDINPYIDGKYNILIPTSNDYWNDEFAIIDNNDDMLNLYNKVFAIMDNLKNKLPFIMKNKLSPSFLPLVNKEMVREGISFWETLKEEVTPNWAFSDVIKDNKDIPIRYTGLTDEESNILDKIETSDNLLAIIRLFGQSANHFYFYNNVKSSVLLGQEILKKATPIMTDYMGRPLKDKGGDEKKYEKGQGLSNEMLLLQETINNVMFLHKTKPEFALTSKFEVKELDELIEVIDSDLERIKEGKSSSFTEEELLEEMELVEKVDKYMKDGTYDKVSAKFKSAKTGDEYYDLKKLYNFYLNRLDEAKKQYKNKEINKLDYDTIIKKLSYRMSLLQRKTVYGSKIIDTMIKQRRALSLMLNPFSAFRNFVGGFLNGLIYAGDGTDFEHGKFSKNLAKVSMMMLNRKSDESYKLYKVARKLLVLDNPIDLQGMSERGWFENYGFKLMEASEVSVRMAIMKSMLEKEGLYDSFDKEGNFVIEGVTVEESKKKMNELTLKIERVNTGIMGDTTNFKLINSKVLGRAIGQFKSSWMPETFASRLEDAKFDYKLGREIKGRYRTYMDLGIVGSLVGVLQVYQSWFFGRSSTSFDNLKTSNGEPISQADILNLYRNTVEASFIISLISLGYLLSYLRDDDDENKEAYMFAINQMLLIERDLSAVSPNTIQELVGGNLIPSWSIVRNLSNATSASLRFFTDNDEFKFEEWLYKISKVIPVMNTYAQFSYQVKHDLDQLN